MNDNNYEKSRKRLAMKRKKKKQRRLLLLLGGVLVLFTISMTILVALIKHGEQKTAKGASPPIKATAIIPKAQAKPLLKRAPITVKAPIPPSDPVSNDYFKDALFIGDSRTQALQLYSGLEGATFYAAKGLNVQTIFKKPAVVINGKKMTIIEALKQKQFGKVYIMFGINELGWPSTDSFINYYGKVVDAVKQTQPKATIYVQSILPVSAKKAASPGTIFTNKNINEHNARIFQMASSKGVYYINLDDFAKGSDGALYADATTDGIHLNKAYCLKWVDCLKTHTTFWMDQKQQTT